MARGQRTNLASLANSVGDHSPVDQIAATPSHSAALSELLLSIRADHGAITPASLHALRGFLDATDWRCIYGLNFGSGSSARAADEAVAPPRIASTAGPM